MYYDVNNITNTRDSVSTSTESDDFEENCFYNFIIIVNESVAAE